MHRAPGCAPSTTCARSRPDERDEQLARRIDERRGAAVSRARPAADRDRRAGPARAARPGVWGALFGVPAIQTFRSERENVDEDILSLAGVEIDLMQPIDPAGKPKVHEPALNHIRSAERRVGKEC